MKKILFTFYCLLLTISFSFAHVENDDIKKLDQSIEIPRISNGDLLISAPSWAIQGTYGEIKIKFVSATHPKLVLNNNILEFIINGAERKITFDEKGEAVAPIKFSDESSINILAEDFFFKKDVTIISVRLLIIVAVIVTLFIARKILKRKRESKYTNE